LAGEPVRGMEIIGPDGQPIPLLMPDELADPDWAEDDELNPDKLTPISK